MALEVTHQPTLAAMKAAPPTQTAQVAAFMAAFPGGNVTCRIMAGSTLRSTVVVPLVVNAAVNPIQITPGTRVSRAFAAGGAMTRVILANAGGTDIAELTAGVGTGDVPFAGVIATLQKERFTFVITPDASLPVGAPATASLTLSASGNATVGVPYSITALAANISAGIVGTPENVTGSATFSPTTINPAPGELSKLFSATYAAAGSASVRVTAPGGIVSNTLLIPVVAAPTPTPPPPPPAPGSLPSLTLTATSAATQPWSVGHVFADGDLTAAQTLATHQLNVISTWPSGCARFGIVSGVTALSSGANTITLTRGTAPTGSTITTATLQAAMTQPVEVAVSGIGSASWSGADWLSPLSTWASGPVMSSWVYRKPVGSDAHLVAWLEVRMWSNGAVEVLPWVENGYIFVAGGRSVDATYSFTMGGTTRESLTMGIDHGAFSFTGTSFEVDTRLETGTFGATSRVASSGSIGTATYASFNSGSGRHVYNVAWDAAAPGAMTSVTALGLPHHCRAPLVSGTKLSHWLGSDPGVVVTHDTGYMQATEMVPTYGATVTGADYPVTRLPSSFTPLQRGGYASVMGTAGASEDIGILPDWDAAYLCGQATAVWAGLQRNAYSAGRFGIYFRDEATNKPLRFSQHPTLVVQSPTIGSTSQSTVDNYAVQGTGVLPAFWQNSHHPGLGYMAALVTGRFFHVETCQFGGTVAYLGNGNDPDRRDGSKGLLRSYWGANLTRGAAWGLRSLVNALVATPDADPLKSEFRSSWSSNLNYYHDRYATGSHNPQGWVTPYSNQNEPNSPWMAQSWMDDFFTSVMGYARCLQVSTLAGDEAKMAAFFDWKAKSIVGRTGLEVADDYLYRDLGQYFMAYSPGNSTDWAGGTGPWYNTWGEVYAGTVSYWGNNVSPTFIGDKQLGDGSLRNHNGVASNSYFANAIPALAYAVRWGVPGAVEGYRRVLSAPNWATFAADSAGWPVFHVRPSVPSWRAAISPGTWAGVGTNTIDDLNPRFNPAINPIFPSGFQAMGFQAEVVSAWCGAAWVEGERKLYVGPGGGHSNYSGNETYIWDGRSAKFNLPATAWPTGSIGFSPGYNQIDGLQATGKYADGRVRAYHSYANHATRDGREAWFFGGAAGAPDIDATNKSALWRWEEPTGNWVDNKPGFVIGGNVAGGACWDSRRDLFYICGGGVPGGVSSYNPNTKAFATIAGADTNNGNYCLPIYDPLRDCLLLFTDSFRPNLFKLIRLAAIGGAVVPASVTGTIPPNNEVTSGIGRGPGTAGVVYAAAYDKFLYWIGGTTLYVLTPPARNSNPLTAPWNWSTLNALGGSADPGNAEFNGTYGRFWYSIGMDCVGVFNATTQKMHVFSLKGML